MNRTVKRVKLHEIRTEVMHGRGVQTNDPKFVLYLVSLLEAGVKFKDRILLTEDKVLIGGHHRTEAYTQYFANIHKGDPAAYAEVEIEADILPQSWDDSTEVQRVNLWITAAITDNAHTGGRAYTAYCVRVHVGVLKNGPAKLTQKQIRMLLVAQGVPDAWVTRAFRDLADSENQRKLAAARGFKREGYSTKEALQKANLPLDTDLSIKPLHDKLRHNKLKKAMETIIRQWDTLYKEHRTRYDGGSITQQQYKNLYHTMRNEVTRLQRKADGITKQVEDHLRDSAGLIRTVGASENLPLSTF